MSMHGAGSGKTGSGPGPAADGFVVLVFAVAESEIVHGSLRRGHHLQCGVERIHDMLGGFHVSGHHRRRILRIQHTAFRNDDPQRFQTARVERNIAVDQRPEHIQNRRPNHRQRAR